jgi:VWFA-related protein
MKKVASWRASACPPAVLAISVSAWIGTSVISGQQFRASTSLVQVDVVVRNTDHRHATRLDQSDFAVFENDLRQEIRTFVEVNSDASNPVPGSEREQLESNGERRASWRKQPAGYAAVVFEQLSPQARVSSGDAARAFVSEALASHIAIAVYTVDRAPHALTEFTEDRETLDKAIEKGRRFAGYPIEYAGEVPGVEFGSPTMPGWIAPASPATALDVQYARGHATLDGLAAVVGTLRPLPGRKVLLLFSEGLALGADPNGRRDSGLDDNRWTRLQHIIERANRFRVAFYSVDAAGLRAQNPGTIAKTMLNTGQMPYGLEPYVGLLALAKDTGGSYGDNSNDLVKFAERAAEDIRHYYLIGYSSSNPKLDGKYRSIRVTVRGEGLEVFARKGYLATARADP